MGVVWTFLLSSILSLLSPSLWKTAQYGLKYCLKGPLNPKQPTNQPTDEECVISWAVQNKISSDAIERLFKEGFTSKEALKLLDSDALARIKIPRGQQNLILASVARLLKSKDSAGYNAQAQSQDNPNQSNSSAAVAQTSYNDQSSATGTGTPSTMAAPRWINNRQEQIS